MNNTEKMLDSLIGMGHLVGYDPETAAKLISHQHKMVLLRFYNDWQDSNDKYYEYRFMGKWLPIRKYLEGIK